MAKYVAFDIAVRKLGIWYNDLAEANGSDDDFVKGYGEAMDNLADVPAADVQEVKHGKWTIRYEGTYKRAKCYCSVCGKPNGIGGIISNQKKPYCPNCGARIEDE